MGIYQPGNLMSIIYIYLIYPTPIFMHIKKNRIVCVMVSMLLGSSPGRVKLKTLKLVFLLPLLSIQH